MCFPEDSCAQKAKDNDLNEVELARVDTIKNTVGGFEEELLPYDLRGEKRFKDVVTRPFHTTFDAC